MESNFYLDERLKADAAAILDLELSMLLLFNNANFPWFILVPKLNSLKEIIDLSEENQQILLKEINQVSNFLKKRYKPDKLNIAALGNIVEQLHIHIVARFKTDKAWPNPTFGFEKKKYTQEEVDIILKKLQDYL